MREALPRLSLCFVSFGLAQTLVAADPATRNVARIDRETADRFMSEYLSKSADFDEPAILELMHFQAKEDRDIFVEGFRRSRAAGPSSVCWDRSKEIYHVTSRHKKQHSTMMYLVPTKAGYVPMTFDVVEVNGRARIRYTRPPSPSPGDSPVQSAIDSIKKEIRSWRDAEGDALEAKATDFKERLQDQIAAISMAKDKKLRLVDGAGTSEGGLRVYNALKSLSGAELRTHVIGELEAKLAEFARQTQPS